MKNQDCLGICLRMTRGGEVVIVDPNFIKIEEIGYSSFVSLNSMFMALKYFLDHKQSDLEVINVHGGFLKNFKSHFLDGTHRSQYNAMIPLYINEFHWKIARLLLEPLFGYLVTLNIDGYAANQYYTLYFLVLEKVILDMIENKSSEAIKRIFEQIKICCQNILIEFYILKPDVKGFIEDRLKRTKDIWPNLASYLLYIYFNDQEKEIVSQNFETFSYSYFEELLRRFIAKKLVKTAEDMDKIFNIDKKMIAEVVTKLFDDENIEENAKIASLTNEELIEYIRNNANINLINEETMFDQSMIKLLTDSFEKFSTSKSVKLFNFVFDCNTDFFAKQKNHSVSIMYQIAKYGLENDKWRFYQNYTRFDCMQQEESKFLRNEYMNLVCIELRSELGKLNENLKNYLAGIIAKKYLCSKDFRPYKFCTGETNYSLISSLLQEVSCDSETDVQRIFWFLQNSFRSKSYDVAANVPNKKVFYRFFKVIYGFESSANDLELPDNRIPEIKEYLEDLYGEKYNNDQIRELYHENTNKTLVNNHKFVILKYPLSWKLLRIKYDIWNAKYKFDRYRHAISFLSANETSKPKLFDYVDVDQYKKANKFEQFFNKNTISAVHQPAVKKVVKLYEEISRLMNLKPLADLEKEWIQIQMELKAKNILQDTEDWSNDLTKLKHIAVMDLICDQNDNSTCTAGIMIFELNHLKKDDKLSLVEASLLKTKLTQPYISGLLAFRESNAYQELLKKTTIKPQVVIFDGNGILHKREFGLASHIGVLENCATIGFAKKLHFVDGFPYKTLAEFKNYYQPLLNNFQDYCELKTIDNKILGYAYLSGVDSKDPVFVSQGHKVNLATCINIIKLIDSCLKDMGKSSRESLVGYVDKMTRNNLNKTTNFDDQLDNYF